VRPPATDKNNLTNYTYYKPCVKKRNEQRYYPRYNGHYPGIGEITHNFLTASEFYQRKYGK